MGPCLLVSATMKHFSQQRDSVRKMQAFFTKLQQDREFARELITEQDNGEPLTFLPADEMAAISPEGMSEGHKTAYKRMCQDAGDDEIVIDIIQYAAAHMAKTQINMSADLILTEAKREHEHKPVDNVAAERVFGFVGFRHKLAWNENAVRTNGQMMWRMNNVSDWLDSKTPAMRDALIRAVSADKTKQALLRRQKAREEAIAAYKAKEQEEWIAKGVVKQQQKAAVCSSCDIWTEADMTGRLAEYPGSNKSKEKLEAMKQQWRAIKGWATKGKLTFPFKSMPKKGGFDSWFEALKTLLQHEDVVPIMQYREQCKQAPQQDMVQIIERVKQVQMEQVCSNDLKKWMEEAVESADGEVHRSRRHRENDRAHAIERGEDPDAVALERRAQNPAAAGEVGQRNNQEQNDEEPVAAANNDDDMEQEDESEEQSIKKALQNPLEPEQLFNWSAEAEDEVVGDF